MMAPCAGESWPTSPGVTKRPSTCGAGARGGLDRRAKVELFERLRREYEFGIGTVKGVARQFGVHRRMVRQAVESALPPLRGYRPRAKPALAPVVAFIDAILEADTAAPRKQRHTLVLIQHEGWRTVLHGRAVGRGARPGNGRGR